MATWFVAEGGPALGPFSGGPGVYAFVEELLRDLGIDTSFRFTTDVVHVEREEHDEQGFVGSESAGYGWREITNELSSSIPRKSTGYTYGLPGIAINWSLTHEKDGQRGFSDLTKCAIGGELSDEGRARFERVWERVFGAPAHLVRWGSRG